MLADDVDQIDTQAPAERPPFFEKAALAQPRVESGVTITRFGICSLSGAFALSDVWCRWTIGFFEWRDTRQRPPTGRVLCGHNVYPAFCIGLYIMAWFNPGRVFLIRSCCPCVEDARYTRLLANLDAYHSRHDWNSFGIGST
jgi:hypothetical protein